LQALICISRTFGWLKFQELDQKTLRTKKKQTNRD
jgi:hypothetical protein